MRKGRIISSLPSRIADSSWENRVRRTLTNFVYWSQLIPAGGSINFRPFFCKDQFFERIRIERRLMNKLMNWRWHKWRRGRFHVREERDMAHGRGRGKDEEVGRAKTGGSAGPTKCNPFYSWKVDGAEKKIDAIRARARKEKVIKARADTCRCPRPTCSPNRPTAPVRSFFNCRRRVPWALPCFRRRSSLDPSGKWKSIKLIDRPIDMRDAFARLAADFFPPDRNVGLPSRVLHSNPFYLLRVYEGAPKALRDLLRQWPDQTLKSTSRDYERRILYHFPLFRRYVDRYSMQSSPFSLYDVLDIVWFVNFKIYRQETSIDDW